MAEPQDIPQPNQEQEAILQRSPYLKAFLDHPPVIGAAWLDDLEPLGQPVERGNCRKAWKQLVDYHFNSNSINGRRTRCF